MTSLLLRTLNPLFIFLIGVVAVGVQTSLFKPWPLNYLQPDILLLFVLWMALRRGFTEGGLLTLVLANLAEIHSGAPRGTWLVAYMAIYLAVRGTVRWFVFPNLPSLVPLVVAAALASKAIALGTLVVFTGGAGGATGWRGQVLYSLVNVPIQGLLSLWVFRWLERFDTLTFKNIRSDSLEDELRIVGEDQEGF